MGDSLGRVTLFKMQENSPSDWSTTILIDEAADGILHVGWLHRLAKKFQTYFTFISEISKFEF